MLPRVREHLVKTPEPRVITLTSWTDDHLVAAQKAEIRNSNVTKLEDWIFGVGESDLTPVYSGLYRAARHGAFLLGDERISDTEGNMVRGFCRIDYEQGVFQSLPNGYYDWKKLNINDRAFVAKGSGPPFLFVGQEEQFDLTLLVSLARPLGFRGFDAAVALVTKDQKEIARVAAEAQRTEFSK